jgi:AcrR family transcriptional regulator
VSDTAPATRGRPRSAKADERILAVALDHLRLRGYRDLSMEHVAADAGVGKATVYRRYRNKADLASAALAMVSAARFAPPVPDDTREALVEHLRLFETGIATVGIGALGSLLDERDPEALELHRERTIRHGQGRMRAILERARERGEIRADADLEIAIEMLVGAYFARRLNGRDAPDWADAAVDTLLRGLAR